MSFLLGIILCAAAVGAVVLGGGSPLLLLDYKALLLVILGTVASVPATLPFSAVGGEFRTMLSTFRKGPRAERVVSEILSLARIARKNGVLALEGREKEVSDPVLKKGLSLISSSAEHETVRDILQKEADCKLREERSAQEYIERMAGFTIGIGLIGTLVEIVQLLYKYSSPKSLAPEIARALLPTVYGALIAYFILLPFAARLRIGSERHRKMRELSVEGVFAIQAGEPIYLVEQRLTAFLSSLSGSVRGKGKPERSGTRRGG